MIATTFSFIAKHSEMYAMLIAAWIIASYFDDIVLLLMRAVLRQALVADAAIVGHHV
jgi:hypothetical protein